MTDEEHADAIRDAAHALNHVVRAAARAGLRVSIDTVPLSVIGEIHASIITTPHVERVHSL